MNDAQSLKWIPERARRLAADDVVPDGNWSLEQVCEHLALAIEATLSREDSGSEEPRLPFSKRWRRLKQYFMKRGLLLTGRFPKNVPAPEFVVPSRAPSLVATLIRLETAVEAFERAIERSNGPWPDHPMLGRMSGAEWRRFHWIHASHHYSLFRRSAK